MDGANALAAGVGPLPLAAAFAAFSSSTSPLPYYPGMILFVLHAAWFGFGATSAWPGVVDVRGLPDCCV